MLILIFALQKTEKSELKENTHTIEMENSAEVGWWGGEKVN
jgi:hypothetical protein